ncbi:MAG: glycoside hydrolase family 18 protein [Bacteroidota bacterium]
MAKLFLPIILLLGVFCWACQGLQTSPELPLPPYRLIAYASDLMPRSSAQMLTHINFSFGNVVEGEVKIESRDSLRLSRMHRLKRYNPHLQILLSVGGWAWSDGFSDAALTDSSRHLFARSAVRVMKHFQLDGIDIDWEYPAQPGDDNPHRPEDTQNYTLLLQTLRQYLEAQSLVDNRPPNKAYLLTVATAASQSFLDLTEMDQAIQYLDFVNVMTYDFYGAWTPQTGHHANLRPSDTTAMIERSAQQAITEHLAAGIPKEKLVLGAAFYGRGWTGVKPEKQGLHQPYDGEALSAAYKELVADFARLEGTLSLWDSTAQTPFLWNEAQRTFYSYEDTLSLRLKANYVQNQGLGGMMFWHIRHDTADVLLGSIYRNLQQ